MTENIEQLPVPLKDTTSEAAEQAASRPAPARCEYAHFDPKTLAPLNEATRRRAVEVAFRTSEFEGKTVLDIGCHTGFLSFLAATKGAIKVTSYDVAKAHVEELRAAQAINGLPVSGAVKGFAALDAAEDAADVVLFFEVIHWLVAQGGDIPAIIAKVAALTGGHLFIEFPWDVTEPSIQAQTKLTRKEYDSSLILAELCRHFETVTVRQFMTYFGTGGRSVRALVSASKKKLGGALAARLPGLTGFELKLDWSRGNCTWIEGRPKSYVVKRSAPESSLQRVDGELLAGLLDGLSSRRESLLVLPLKLDDTYFLDSQVGQRSFIYEWIGEPPFGKQPIPNLSMSVMIDLAIKITFELARLPSALVAALSQGGLRTRIGRARMEAYLEKGGGVLGISSEEIEPWLALADAPKDDTGLQLCHGDMQTSNILVSGGEFKIVDIDNFLVGSPYSDVCGVLANACTLAEITEGLERASRALSIPPASRYDVLYGIYFALGWIAAVVPRADAAQPKLVDLVERKVAGLKSLMAYGDGIGR